MDDRQQIEDLRMARDFGRNHASAEQENLRDEIYQLKLENERLQKEVDRLSNNAEELEGQIQRISTAWGR